MVRVIVVECFKVPDVPVTVIVNVPLAAVLLMRSVSVLDVVAGFALKDAVTPLNLRRSLLRKPTRRVESYCCQPPPKASYN